MAADHQPPRYDRRRTEAMDTHVLVMRGRHGVRSGDHVVEDVISTHRAVVLGVDKPVREAAPEDGGIAVDQREGPIILQSQERACLGVLRANGLRIDGTRRDEQYGRDKGLHRWTPPVPGILWHLASSGAVEDHPRGEVRGELFEAMLRSGRHEQEVAGLERIALTVMKQNTSPSYHDVDLILCVRRLLIRLHGG